jgi:DNA transformation protein
MSDDEDEFTAYLIDALRPWGAVATRRMFGAISLWRGGAMFGFVTEDGLWLKGGASNRAALEAAGAEQFVYDAGKRQVAMSFWSCPAEALDDPEALRRWVDGAWRVAAAAAKAKGKRKR